MHRITRLQRVIAHQMVSMCKTVPPNVDVKLRAAFQARGHRSGVPFAANELHAASGELQTA